MTNFYNLPPPWNPGYAPYDPAEAEGIERRSITTQQAPRGTYDEPTVSDAGYAVPRYVLDEGYGQGAIITAPMPRGTVDMDPTWLTKPTSSWRPAGREDGGELYNVTVLEGDPVYDFGAASRPDPFATYGQKAARSLLARLQSVPRSQKQQALRVVLDKLDPSLWSRTATEAARWKGAPAPVALERGLAAAMAKGIRGEVVRMGETRRAPGPRSLLGLSVHGAAVAMGAVLEELGTDAANCAYEVVPATATAPAFVRRVQASGRVYPAPEPCALTGRAPTAPPLTEWLEVGPFRLPVDGPFTFNDHRGVLTDAWKDAFKGALTQIRDQAKQLRFTGMGTILKPAKNYGLDKWLGWAPNDLVYPALVNGQTPAFKVKHPKNGQDWGLYLVLTPTSFGYQWKRIPDKSFWGSLWNAIKSLGAKVVQAASAVVGFAGDALGALKDLACEAMQSPGTAQAAASAGGAAGAAGAVAAQTLCKPKAEAPAAMTTTTPPPGGGMSTLLLVGGAVGLGVLLLKRRG